MERIILCCSPAKNCSHPLSMVGTGSLGSDKWSVLLTFIMKSCCISGSNSILQAVQCHSKKIQFCHFVILLVLKIYGIFLKFSSIFNFVKRHRTNQLHGENKYFKLWHQKISRSKGDKANYCLHTKSCQMCRTI